MATNDVRKLPPQSVEAEMSVLGGILIDNEAINTVLGYLDPEDFYRESHRKILVAMKSLSLLREPCDLITLTNVLKKQGELEDIGGAAYVCTLIDYVPTAANILYYCKIVKEKSSSRKLINSLTQIISECYEDESDTTKLLSHANQILVEAGNHRHGSGDVILTLADMAKIYTTHVSNSDKNRFKTGFDGLDAIITGVSPGEVLTVVAYSGLGKSAFLHNMLLDSCRRTAQHHIFFSLEMPATRVFERTVQIALGRYTYNIESEFHHHNSDKQVSTMIDLVSSNANKLLCCEQGGLSMDKIEHYTRLAQSKHGKIGAIGIDYLGLMAAPGTKGEYERISAAAEGAKHLAKRLNIPVIMLCQISREAAKLGKTEMHSAKGSGAVEASADYMVSLERTKDGIILAKVLKNRNGESDVTFQADISWPFLRFNRLEPYDDKASKNIERSQKRQAKGGWQDDKDDDPY